jgi:hypothetical protein
VELVGRLDAEMFLENLEVSHSQMLTAYIATGK